MAVVWTPEALTEPSRVSELEHPRPGLARSCRGGENVVIIYQDSFAADCEDHEYTLFGKALKFAGLHRKEVRVIGTNRRR